MGYAYKVDFVVDDGLLIECKAAEVDHPVFQRQIITYLRLADKRLGQLMNFGAAHWSDAYRRVVNNPRSSAFSAGGRSGESVDESVP